MTTVECISVVDTHLRGGSPTRFGVVDSMGMSPRKQSSNDNVNT